MQNRMVKDLELLSKYDEQNDVDIIYSSMRRILKKFGKQREIAKTQNKFLKVDIPKCIRVHQLELDVLDDCRLDKLQEFWKKTKILESTRDQGVDQYVSDTYLLVAMIGENKVIWKLDRIDFGWGCRTELNVSLGGIKDVPKGVNQLEEDDIDDKDKDDSQGDEEITNNEDGDEAEQSDDEGGNEESIDDENGNVEEEEVDDNEDGTKDESLIRMKQSESSKNSVKVALEGKGQFGDLTGKEIIHLLYLISAFNEFDDRDELYVLRDYITGPRKSPDITVHFQV